jgi:hypothetical protein
MGHSPDKLFNFKVFPWAYQLVKGVKPFFKNKKGS